MRINIYWREEYADLWERIQQEAREASAREGRDVSASEWLAEAALRRLEQEAAARAIRAEG